MPVKNDWEQGRETTTNRQMESTPRFETAQHWWEATALTTTPFLLPHTDQTLVELIKFRLTLCGQHLPPFLARDH